MGYLLSWWEKEIKDSVDIQATFLEKGK